MRCGRSDMRCGGSDMRCGGSDMRCGGSDMRCGRSDMRCGRGDMRCGSSFLARLSTPGNTCQINPAVCPSRSLSGVQNSECIMPFSMILIHHGTGVIFPWRILHCVLG